jgi:putative phage-type endonuclease
MMQDEYALDDRDRWLANRKLGIGGSDAAAIMGHDSRRGPLSVYWDKVTPHVPSEKPSSEIIPMNEPAYWGTRLEEILAQEFARRTGYIVRPAPESMSHPDRPWQLGSIDRFYYKPRLGEHIRQLERRIQAGLQGPDGILEIKTTTLRKEGEWLNGPPMYPYCQTQHYLSVTGLQEAWIVCLVGGQKFFMYPVQRDLDFIDEMVTKETEFWRRVENHDPPPVDGLIATSSALSGIPAAPDKVVELEPDAIEYFVKLHDLNAALNRLEQDRETVVNTIKSVMGDAEKALLAGAVVVTWKPQKRTHVDIKALRLEEPDLVAGHTFATESRTFKVNVDDELLSTFRDLLEAGIEPATDVDGDPPQHGVRVQQEGDLLEGQKRRGDSAVDPEAHKSRV